MSELVEEERFDIFVSYAEADRAWVEGYLLDGLQSASLTTIAQHDFRLGVPALIEFERAIKESRYTLLIISSAWLATDNSSFIEVLAQTWGTETNSWPVIPLLLEESVLPARLSMLVPVDMREVETRDQVLVRLCKQLQAAVPRNNQSPACPYPGMVAFSENESRYFFGRDQEIETITQKLRYYPFICVIGASGSGKSSLVFAGLIPALRPNKLFGEGEWRVVDMRPGEHPLTIFQTSVAAGRSGKGDNSERLLLVVDQFEETFAANREEAAKFIKALLEFYQQPSCFLILTVRADFYDELIKSDLWSEIQSHRVEITGLNEQNLRSAIVKPAETVGVYIEGVLVERLLAGAGQEPGVLPILQEIMVRLWQRLERRLLPLRAYESLILPYKKDGLSTLQALLAQFADEIVAQLPADQQAIARRIFVRLVQFGEGRADTRRQQSIPDLRIVGESESAFEQTLSHLVNRRLLTISSDNKGQRYVDIAHEKMIERWPTLQAWIREHKESEKARRRLESKSNEWIRLGRGDGGLLDETELDEIASGQSDGKANELGFSEILNQFIEASRKANNPGWHRWGTIVLGSLAVSIAGLLGIVYLASQSLVPALQVLSLIVILTLVLFLANLFGLLRRDEKFRGQKLSQQLAHSRLSTFGALLVLGIVGIAWGQWGINYVQRQQYCTAKGFVHTPTQQWRVGIGGENVEPFYLQIISTVLKLHPNVDALNVSSIGDLTDCQSYFSHRVNIIKSQLETGEIHYEAHIEPLPSNSQLTELPGVTTKQENCEIIYKLAFEIVNRIGIPTSTQSSGIGTQTSCETFELTFNGYQSYAKAFDNPASELEVPKLQEAEQQLKEAILLSNQTYSPAYNYLGLVYWQKAAIDSLTSGKASPDYQNALNAFTVASSLLPNSSPYLRNWGIACYYLDDYVCAEEKLLRAMEIAPSDIQPLIQLVNLNRIRHKFDQAELYWQKAQPLLTQNRNMLLLYEPLYRSELYMNYGLVQFEQKNWLQAIEYFEEAKNSDPRLIEEIEYYLALSYKKAGNVQKACKSQQIYNVIPSMRLFGEFTRRKNAVNEFKDIDCPS